MDDLIAFLRARLDDDEQAAHAAGGAPWTADDVPGSIHVEARARAEQRALRGLGFVGSVEREPDRQHIARHDPARVLREVEAKRRTLARHPGATVADECPGCGAYLDGTWKTPPGALCPELADLALPYTDHPAYREAWRP